MSASCTSLRKRSGDSWIRKNNQSDLPRMGASGTGDRVVCPQRIRACVQTRECRCSSGGESAVLVRPRSWVRDPSSALDVHHPQIRAPLATLNNRCQALGMTWFKTRKKPSAIPAIPLWNIRGSFNGRTLASKPRYEGSNPSPRAVVDSGQVNKWTCSSDG